MLIFDYVFKIGGGEGLFIYKGGLFYFFLFANLSPDVGAKIFFSIFDSSTGSADCGKFLSNLLKLGAAIISPISLCCY